MDITAAITELQATLEGEIDATSVRLAQYSTDASNYRVLPQLVIMPRHESDVIAAVKIAARHDLPVTVRGGGTSCAGNAVGPG